ncbi:MAG: hypothetical protein NZ455_01595 [Bacteroidia bacterium]|nr:hypothetical protein [Bacteroidia bacterium]
MNEVYFHGCVLVDASLCSTYKGTPKIKTYTPANRISTALINIL